MLPVILLAFVCRAHDVQIDVGGPPDSVVRRVKAPRLMSLEIMGRPIVVRFAPRRGVLAKRDSVTADSLVKMWQSVPIALGTSCSSLDLSPRLSAPALCRGDDPVRIDYGVGEWGARSRLEIFDVAGRRVASLPITTTPQGRGVTWWQPAAGPGVYFLRLIRPDAVLTRRIVRAS
jgi:hypothetical protein